MSIICPNLKNKEVKQQFDELVAATSEQAAYHIWSQNEGLPIDYTPVNREVVVDIDQRIEDVSNMILNKLLVKKSPFRSKKIEKNYMSTNDTSFVVDRMSNVYYDITGLQLFDEYPNGIEEAIEILKFNLRNNFMSGNINKMREMSSNSTGNKIQVPSRKNKIPNMSVIELLDKEYCLILS